MDARLTSRLLLHHFGPPIHIFLKDGEEEVKENHGIVTSKSGRRRGNQRRSHQRVDGEEEAREDLGILTSKSGQETVFSDVPVAEDIER